MNAATFEIALLQKFGGEPLTKRISLGPDGSVISDGGACIMSRGTATRFQYYDVQKLGEIIDQFGPDQAITLGTLRPDLPDTVEITTKRKLNGSGSNRLIARTKEYFQYRQREPALTLLDYDRKGMPGAVAERIKRLGGLEAALASIVPDITRTERLVRASTSAGLYREDTGDALPSSGGQHIFLKIRDGEDSERFLKVLHERCWLAGLGWKMVGAGGQLLDRSIVDRVVGTPERLVFEGPPVLVKPIAQDLRQRRPLAIAGGVLDSRTACPPLTLSEQARLRQLRAKEDERLNRDAQKARKLFVAAQAEKLTRRTGMEPNAAARIVERQCAGVLLPRIVLPFDDDDLAGCTVADVLADPARFEDATLSDPLEGVEYGASKAKILRRSDGTPWIHSFAHGRTVYELRYDYTAAEAVVRGAAPEQVARTFVRLVLAADLDRDEVERLRNIAAEVGKVTKPVLDAMLKSAREEQEERQCRERRIHRLATRRDPRPQLDAPPPDAEWNPQMEALNEVLGAVAEPEPPMRDIDGFVVKVRIRRAPKTHTFTSLGANAEETENTRLPPPELSLLTRLDVDELGEMIEHHIEYVDEYGCPVHLGVPFVRHFLRRDDDKLPLAAAIATVPIVMGDGTLLGTERGLVRDYGIIFRVPLELLNLLPVKEACTPGAVAKAMHFLCDEWLVDVACDYSGKCVLIAAALTIVERSLLPDRPAFWVTAGRRGGGKTTTLIMLIRAVTGLSPPAAAWSPSEEERRKALLAYLMEALACIIWDNIPRGHQISCPHIEKSCTTEFYQDRKLGVNEIIAVAAAMIHFFTGNNIAPRGDLASRSLQVRLDVDRPDPENREFTHSDPIGWTDANRGKILTAFYTILLGNPRFRGSNRPLETRFKTWWALIGQAVEHAAKQHKEHADGFVVSRLEACPPTTVSFKNLFLTQEEDDGESASLADALEVLLQLHLAPDGGSEIFSARDVARHINHGASEFASDSAKENADTLRDFLFPDLPPNQQVNSTALGTRLRRHVDAPVAHAGKILKLRKIKNTHEKRLEFYIEARAS